MKKFLSLLLAAILLLSSNVFAMDTCYDDPMYWNQQQGDGLFEEETITFDKYRPRALRSGETLRRGVDISFYQNERADDNKIDWKALKADNVDFVFIRVGYRGYGSGTLTEDPYYRENIEGALDAGLLVGVYVYSQAITPEEGREEAQFLLERIGNYDISLPLIMDYEYAGNGIGRLYNAKLSKADATAICCAFSETVGKAGYQSAIYANKSFLNNQLYASALDRVWLAHYITETDYTGDYDFWQFTSSGSVDGVVGLTDLNFWFDDGSVLTGLPFLDVKTDDWFYEGVKFAYDRGVTSGVWYNRFGPAEITSRGQVMAMLYRLAGSPAVSQQATFTDLQYDYYRDAVAWGQASGITTGAPGNKFLPEDSITRQDLVVMLYRLSGSPAVTGDLSGFVDCSSVSDYAVDAMIWAVKNDIVRGTSSMTPTLSPFGTATRGETVALLARYAQIN